MDRQKEDSYQIVNYYKRNRTIDILYKLIPNIFTEICFKKSLDDTGFILICYYKIIYIRNSISVDSGSNTFFVKKCLNFLNTLGQVGNGFGIQFNFYTVTCV